MMKEADGNGDGEISFDEFKEIMNKFFNWFNKWYYSIFFEIFFITDIISIYITKSIWISEDNNFKF